MESDWAAEHLQVIRTLMERSAIYRRALAPIMMVTGSLGVLGAAVGLLAGIGAGRDFVVFWMAVCLGAVLVAFVLARRQALKDREPFWSPPTRRVTQALLPPLFAGLVLGLWAALVGWGEVGVVVLPIWIMLYGCAIHAAGFFMPRGMKLFGWAMIVVATALLLPALFRIEVGAAALRYVAHGAMGFAFGVLHLLYGVYLYFTENRKNAP